MKRFLFALAATLIVPAACRAQSLTDRLQGLDGVLATSEIDAATRILQDGATTLFAAQDTAFLSIRVKAEALAVASLCLASADTVRVLHASAALGSLTYGRQGETWHTGDRFQWEMRDPAATETARAARHAYLDAHGWVATTMQMGRPGEVEFLIRRDLLPAGDVFLAAGLMPSTRPNEILGLPAATAGDCADYGLVAGNASSTPFRFQPATWLKIAD